MKLNPEFCIDCKKSQIKRAMELVDLPEEEKENLRKECEELALDLSISPAHSGTRYYRLIKERNGYNPFDKWKENTSLVAKRMLEEARPKLDSLRALCRAAISANFIDFATFRGDSNNMDLGDLTSVELAIDDTHVLEEKLENAETVLYLPDNYGEHFFDLLLVERLAELGKKVIVVGKESPIMNDATVEDLEKAGFEKFSTVISIGTDCVGTKFDEASEEFKKIFNESDIVIAKGMGHYETLDDAPREIVFMLKAKCKPVALSLGVNKGENVLKVKD